MIIPAGDRITEAEATEAVLAYLKTKAYGEATFEDMWRDLPGKFIAPTDEDREYQNKRTEELKWYSAVRNIGAHQDKPGNAIYEGLLVKVRGSGYQLAEEAAKRAAKQARWAAAVFED